MKYLFLKCILLNQKLSSMYMYTFFIFFHFNLLSYCNTSDLYPLDKVPHVKTPWYPTNLPSVAWNPWTDIRERDDVQSLNLSFPYGPVPDKFSQLIRQSYFAATSYMDQQVGHLLEGLEDSGFANNTIVVFVGDHGG